MKKFDFLRPFVALVAATGLLMLGACNNGLIDPKDTPATAVVTTTVGGMVVDEAGSPMAGVAVTAHGSTTTTNAQGLFQFKNISVPNDRACVIARKNGYFNAAHAEWPKQNGVTLVQLTMQKAAITTTFSASAGGTATVSASSVTFPANGIVTSTGAAYTGTVSVAAAYLTPDERLPFQQFFAGDAAARRADNSLADLLSYGVLRVQLTGASGEQLQLRSGSTATLRYPVPTRLASSQPSTIPLWYFDESIGMWKEEGQATFTGGVYVGSVSHFTDWNLDVPNARRAFVEGTVRCAANRPVPHVWVTIGQVGAMTDENGYFKRRVPADFAFTIEVDPSRNNGMSATPYAISGIAENATETVEIMASPCPTMLEGTLVDCNDKPIGGFVQVLSSRGAQMASTANGTFRMNVPAGEILKVTAYSIDAQSSSETPVAAIATGDNFNMGTIQACSGAQTTYLDIPLSGTARASAMAYLDNGATLAVLDITSVKFYTASTGALVRSLDVTNGTPNTYAGSRIMFSADGSVMMVGGPYSTTRVFQTASGTQLCTITDPGNGYLTSDGKSVITMDSSGSVSQFDVSTGQIVKTFGLPKGTYNMLGLQGGGTRFVVSSYLPSTAFIVWDVATDSKVLEIPLLNTRETSGSLSPDGTVVGMLAPSTNQKGGPLEFYNLITGAKISSITPNDPTTYPAMPNAISPDNTLYVGTMYGTSNATMPMVRNVSDGSTTKILPIPALNAYGSAFVFDPNGTHLAAFFSTQAVNVIRIYQM
jgi:hypothetical protein